MVIQREYHGAMEISEHSISFNRWILMDEREIFRKPNIEASCAISFNQLLDKQLPGLTNFKENRWTSTVNLGFYLLAPWNICIYIIPAIFSAVGSAIPSPQLYLINLPEYPEWDPKMCPSSVWGMVLLRTGFEWLKFFTRIGSRENLRGNHWFPSIHSGVPSIFPWFKQITGCPIRQSSALPRHVRSSPKRLISAFHALRMAAFSGDTNMQRHWLSLSRTRPAAWAIGAQNVKPTGMVPWIPGKSQQIAQVHPGCKSCDSNKELWWMINLSFIDMCWILLILLICIECVASSPEYPHSHSFFWHICCHPLALTFSNSGKVKKYSAEDLLTSTSTSSTLGSSSAAWALSAWALVGSYAKVRWDHPPIFRLNMAHGWTCLKKKRCETTSQLGSDATAMEHMETLQNFFCQNERLRNAAETD